MKTSSKRIKYLTLALVAATATVAFACHDGASAEGKGKGKHHHKKNVAAGTAAADRPVMPSPGAQNPTTGASQNAGSPGSLL